jgi:hypothetical protein
MQMKFGFQKDGSLLLPPKAVIALREVMLRRTEGHIALPSHRVTEYLQNFADVLYDECGVEFEVFT